MYYVAVDVGCIECGEETSVLGIFTDKQKAMEVLGEHKKRQEENWSGQHNFELHEVSELNKIYRIEY